MYPSSQCLQFRNMIINIYMIMIYMIANRNTAFHTSLHMHPERSACVSTQADQSLHCLPEDALDPWLPTECLSKTLLILREWAG